MADGTLVYYNYYDNSLYAVAKGPSQTTVTATDVTTLGNKVLVQGSVIDISVGTKQTEQAARFPAGIPAVSDASQAAWMEYVYMKQEKPTDATGVPVVVSVYDPNGNYYTVGTTTSDAMGHFSLVFTPEVSGKYNVIATFAGSGSYYPSSAEVSTFIDEAAATPTPVPTQAPSAADLYFLPAVAGIIVAIVLAAVAIVLLSKKP
jgi:hypothetical protein